MDDSGSLLVGARRGEHLIYLGRVGTGFSQTTLARIFPRLKALETHESPFGGANALEQERGGALGKAPACSR
jgi:bifunctional non-homologous end joining protein LigD